MCIRDSTYSIDAMREAIGGFYGMDYLHDMLLLGFLFVPLGFAIGLGIGRCDFKDVYKRQVLDAEVAGHLRHAQAHGALVAAEAFQDEGQLVPHFVGHDLRIGVLHDESDAGHLLALGHVGERHAIEQHLSALVPMGSERRLDRKSTRLNSSHSRASRMPSSA